MIKIGQKQSRMLFGSLVSLGVLTALWAACSSPVRAQQTGNSLGITAEQLTTLLPDLQDLQGFVRLRPALDTAARLQPELVPDGFDLDLDLNKAYHRSGMDSSISRSLYSTDGVYNLGMTVWVYDSNETAQREISDYRHSTQEIFQPGTFSGAAPIADESWTNGGRGEPSSVVLHRYGRVMVMVEGSESFTASKAGIAATYPSAGVEAVGDMILLRLTGQARLVGVPTGIALVSVNGKAVSRQALMVKGQPYVPVLKFADALGWKSQWDVKTGALNLQGPARKQVRLAAGSTAATASDGQPASLKVPVLKDANAPVMRLGDLVSVFHGRLVSQGNHFRVSI